jgi:hypothetical protein
MWETAEDSVIGTPKGERPESRLMQREGLYAH